MPPTAHNHDAVTSSLNPLWRSPKWLVKALDREFGLVLDCAADTGNAILGLPHLGPGGLVDDALIEGLDWWEMAALGFSLAHDATPEFAAEICRQRALFCNPPYSQKLKMPIEPWIEKMARAGDTGTMVGIVPYSTQTEWWRTYVEGHTHQATEVRKFPFRIRFDPPLEGYDGEAPGANVNTAVVIWKPTEDFLAAPWAPQTRYWVPREYRQDQAERKAAQRDARKARREEGREEEGADA